jgi:L,D-peptidoglycan transpeptidase YkuD (ErfK/YbiS/YcfS/YnhG family)
MTNTVLESIRQYIGMNRIIIGESTQIVFVTTTKLVSSSASIYWVEMISGKWILVDGPLPANIAGGGFALPDEKREGDNKAPSGIFRLGTAFGYGLEGNTKMPYHQVSEDDFWVDDIESPFYNRMVRGKPDARSFEIMKRDDDLYKYGVVIEYNTSPIIKGHGSAIFLHIWKGLKEPTTGCVSLSEESVRHLLSWLDPAKNPIIVMGTESTVFSQK